MTIMPPAPSINLTGYGSAYSGPSYCTSGISTTCVTLGTISGAQRTDLSFYGYASSGAIPGTPNPLAQLSTYLATTGQTNGQFDFQVNNGTSLLSTATLYNDGANTHFGLVGASYIDAGTSLTITSNGFTAISINSSGQVMLPNPTLANLTLTATTPYINTSSGGNLLLQLGGTTSLTIGASEITASSAISTLAFASTSDVSVQTVGGLDFYQGATRLAALGTADYPTSLALIGVTSLVFPSTGTITAAGASTTFGSASLTTPLNVVLTGASAAINASTSSTLSLQIGSTTIAQLSSTALIMTPATFKLQFATALELNDTLHNYLTVAASGSSLTNPTTSTLGGGTGTVTITSAATTVNNELSLTSLTPVVNFASATSANFELEGTSYLTLSTTALTLPTTGTINSASTTLILQSGGTTGLAVNASGNTLTYGTVFYQGSGSATYDTQLSLPVYLNSAGTTYLAITPGTATVALGSTVSTFSLPNSGGTTIQAVGSLALACGSSNMSISSAQISLNSANAILTTNVIINGNLTVNGTTTTIDSDTVNIGDNLINVNSGGGIADAGYAVTRYLGYADTDTGSVTGTLAAAYTGGTTVSFAGAGMVTVANYYVGWSIMLTSSEIALISGSTGTSSLMSLTIATGALPNTAMGTAATLYPGQYVATLFVESDKSWATMQSGLSPASATGQLFSANHSIYTDFTCGNLWLEGNGNRTIYVGGDRGTAGNLVLNPGGTTNITNIVVSGTVVLPSNIAVDSITQKTSGTGGLTYNTTSTSAPHTFNVGGTAAVTIAQSVLTLGSVDTINSTDSTLTLQTGGTTNLAFAAGAATFQNLSSGVVLAATTGGILNSVSILNVQQGGTTVMTVSNSTGVTFSTGIINAPSTLSQKIAGTTVAQLTSSGLIMQAGYQLIMNDVGNSAPIWRFFVSGTGTSSILQLQQWNGTSWDVITQFAR